MPDCTLIENKISTSIDACVKCSACTARCPVASVYPLFPGPKSAGPDTERFRAEGIKFPESILSYCSNCKACEITCPFGVEITKIIQSALQNTKQSEKNIKHKFRSLVLGEAEYLGKVGTLWPPLANKMLKQPLIRRIMEKTLGISSHAPLPDYQKKLRTNHKSLPSSKRVVYFPGCFTRYNDPVTADLVIKLLEHNHCEVFVPDFHCCGVPLSANGRFEKAASNMEFNLKILEPFLSDGVPVITACTSCGLALKDDYAEMEKKFRLGDLTFDLFEFLWELYERQELEVDFQEMDVEYGYHSPCHLRAQGIGTPSVRVLRLIPGVRLYELDEACCGLSGSYGLKEERYELSIQIGQPLFSQVKDSIKEDRFRTVLTECGMCQTQLHHGSGILVLHPVRILAQAYGL